jgi:hypothetical protein
VQQAAKMIFNHQDGKTLNPLKLFDTDEKFMLGAMSAGLAFATIDNHNADKKFTQYLEQQRTKEKSEPAAIR